MRVCMFHPIDRPMERGWVGRIEDERVIHLAAQTLQSFFTGGGSAREHAEYPRSDVRLLAPVLHPPAVRVFDGAGSFVFANPAAIVAPGEEVPAPPSGGLLLVPRLVGVIGTEGTIESGAYSRAIRALDAGVTVFSAATPLDATAKRSPSGRGIRSIDLEGMKLHSPRTPGAEHSMAVWSSHPP